MNTQDTLDEICISYDIKSKSVAFYNVATKNRIRYSSSNYHNLPGVMKHIDSVRPLLHWPRYCHPLRVFIENLRYLNNQTLREDQKESMLRGFWENMWKQMVNA